MATLDEILAAGWKLHQAGRVAEAEQIYRQAVQAAPAHARAWCYHGMACNDLGRYDEAVGSYRRALALRPEFPEALNNLGNTLTQQTRLDEAIDVLRQALRCRPGYTSAYHNLGIVFAQQERLADAEEAFRNVVRLDPNFAEALNGLAAIQFKQGKFADALASYDVALRLKPSLPDARKNRGIARLLLGDFAQGCRDFEARFQCADLSLPALRQPAWDGAPLDGRTILLRAEQGLGDTLQFIRYAPLVKRAGGTVVVECQRPLLPLLAGFAGVDRWVPRGAALPPFDVHAPLMSLPGLLGTTLETIPAAIPYLFADPQLVERWRVELGANPAFKVGIVWKGSSSHRADHVRSARLRDFEPLARVPGVQLFSLQKGEGTEQLAALSGRFPVVDLGSRLDETTAPFLETAAVMQLLDLVVTVDTSTGHLAGALGVPYWLALPFVPDWRWLLEREDSPWYPTARLFRQTARGDWAGVFERMATALARLAAERGASRGGPTDLPPPPQPRRESQPITVEVPAGELIDKITILEIKSERIADASKLVNVRAELQTLTAARDGAIAPSTELSELTAKLKQANAALWDIEDEIRRCERDRDFGPRFIELARAVYHTNDQRAALKRAINELLGSRLVEEKDYVAY
jgi:Flp pilus assembly protein TadD